MAAFRQITGASNDGSASIALTQVYDSNNLSGSLLTMFVWTDSTTATVVVSDTLNGSWTQVGSYQSLSGVGKYSMWRYFGSAAGPNTVTVTFSVSSIGSFYMQEHTADTAVTLDTAAGATGTSTAPSPGSIAVAAAGTVVIAAFVRAVHAALYAGPANFVLRANTGNNYHDTQIADRVSAPSAQTPVFTQGSSVGWLSIGASFALAAAPSPPPPPPPMFYRDMPIADLYAPWFTLQAPFPGPVGFTPEPPRQSPPVPPGVPPVPPPPPPGVPPPPSPLPPPPTVPPGSAELTAVADKIDVDKNIDPRIRRVLELLSITYNSLTGTGQIIRTGPDAFQIVAPGPGGWTGEVDP